MPKISKGDGPSYEPGHDPNGSEPAAEAGPAVETPAVEAEPLLAPAPKK